MNDGRVKKRGSNSNFITKNETVRKFIAILAAIIFGQNLIAQFSTDTIFTQVEIMPCFPGCETIPVNSQTRRQCSDRELVQFISRHLVYPEEAQAKNTEGTVYVSFVVDETGEVQNPALLMDIGDNCGEAALDVIAAMPRWEPGSHLGQKVKVRFNMPIQFSLKNAEDDLSERYTLTWGTLRGNTATVEELTTNLGNPLFVRGPEGDPRYIDQLAFTFERKRKLINAISRGEISGEQQTLVKKIKEGGLFTITASIQDKGQFAYVTRSFQITE